MLVVVLAVVVVVEAAEGHVAGWQEHWEVGKKRKEGVAGARRRVRVGVGADT